MKKDKNKVKKNNSNKKLKIALVQDYIKEFGGAESVLEVLSDIFPDAPIYTSLYRPNFLGPHQQRLEKKWSHRVNQSFFDYIPFAHKIISPLRIFSPLAFKSFDFSGYDLIISSATGAYFPNSLNKKSAKLISYCHTPPRYLYGLPTARKFTNIKIIKSLVNFINHFLRLADFKFAQNVDQFIANSQTTANRISKFYKRQALVINPPIDLPKKSEIKTNNKTSNNSKSKQEKFFLTGGRLARAKRFDIPIQAANRLAVKLKVFGRDFSGLAQELKDMAGPTIEFLGEVSQQEKAKLYSQAQAFIFSAEEEDFGMVPVESMAYGCPVIAYKSGGVTETVVDGKTGIFFNQATSQSCSQAIKKFQKSKIRKEDCLKQASKFSNQAFISKIKKLISSF